MKTETKTYILKRSVYNNLDFLVGIIVVITDDYWGASGSDTNTGFTVVKGKLKGEKGCVADGLFGYICDNTEKNRRAIKNIVDTEKKLIKSIKENDKRFNKITNSILPKP